LVLTVCTVGDADSPVSQIAELFLFTYVLLLFSPIHASMQAFSTIIAQ